MKNFDGGKHSGNKFEDRCNRGAFIISTIKLIY